MVKVSCLEGEKDLIILKTEEEINISMGDIIIEYSMISPGLSYSLFSQSYEICHD